MIGFTFHKLAVEHRALVVTVVSQEARGLQFSVLSQLSEWLLGFSHGGKLWLDILHFILTADKILCGEDAGS
jgi:hypothetical protein